MVGFSQSRGGGVGCLLRPGGGGVRGNKGWYISTLPTGALVTFSITLTHCGFDARLERSVTSY